MNKLYVLFILFISTSCNDRKSLFLGIQNYDLEDSINNTCLLSEIADSIEYYPLSSINNELTNYLNQIDIQLTDDYILLTHSHFGQLYSRYTGELIRDIDLGYPFEQPSYWWGNFVSKNYITASGNGYYIRERIEIKGKPYFKLLVRSLHNDTLISHVNLPSFYSFPINQDIIGEWKDTIMQRDSLTMFYYYDKNGNMLQKKYLKETLQSKRNILHLLNDNIFYHSEGNSKVYLLKDDLMFDFFNTKAGGIKNLHIGLDKLFFTYVFSREEYPIFINNDKIYKLSPINTINIGLVNDIDGGFDFWPKNISYSGEIYSWYSVEELKSKVVHSNLKQMKNPEAVKRLKEMLNNLSKDINVIVAVLKEKK